MLLGDVDDVTGLAGDFERPRSLCIRDRTVDALVRRIAATGARLPALREVRTVGERLDPATRALVRDVLGVPLADAYSAQEVGYIALECPDHPGYHVQSERLLVEVLRDDGAPCATGETGRVVITDLHNFATPILRYDIGDLAEVGAPCPCGRGLPTVRRIVGRSRNLILLPTGDRVWPSLGGFGPEGYLKLLPILQFQILQTEPDLLEVRLVTGRPLGAEQRVHVKGRALLVISFQSDQREEYRFAPAGDRLVVVEHVKEGSGSGGGQSGKERTTATLTIERGTTL